LHDTSQLNLVLENLLRSVRYSTGEIEKYRELLNTARVELEPWEKHIIECESKIGVSSSASKLLKDKVSKIIQVKILVHAQIDLSIVDMVTKLRS
jgi:hypothetical protein